MYTAVVATTLCLEIIAFDWRDRRAHSKAPSSPSGCRVANIGNVTAPVRSAKVAGPRGAGSFDPKKSTITSPDLNSSAMTRHDVIFAQRL